MIDLYAALGLKKTAPKDEVAKAYRKAAKAAHPDGGGSVESFALVKLAFDTLKDDKRRAHYDETGEADAGAPDDAEGRALQQAYGAIEQAISAGAKMGRDPERYDVVGAAIDTLVARIGQIDAFITESRRNADKAAKIAARFKAKKGHPDRIGVGEEPKPTTGNPTGRGAIATQTGSPVNVAFEAVPGKHYDKAMKDRMEDLHPRHVADITTRLQGEFIPKVLRAVGARGDVMPQLGGWEGQTNPSRVVRLGDTGHAMAVANAVGHVFRQDGMMAAADEPFPGSREHSVATITLPAGMNRSVSDLYSDLWKLKHPETGEPLVYGHSTVAPTAEKSGQMNIVHDNDESGLSRQAFGKLLHDHLGGLYNVETTPAHVAFPSAGYGHDLQGLPKPQGSSEPSVQEALDHLQGQAAERLEQYVSAAEAHGKDNPAPLNLPRLLPHEGSPTLVGTAYPTTKRAIAAGLPTPGVGPQLEVSARGQSPKNLAVNAMLAAQHPGIGPVDGPEDALDKYVSLGKNNLLQLYDRFAPEHRATAQGWYEAAHHIGNEIAEDHGLPNAAGHAILAVLSPQNYWDNNVTLAQRVADTMAHAQTEAWSPKFMDVTKGSGKEKGDFIFASPKYAEDMAAIKGKTLAQAGAGADAKTANRRQAMWIRLYDESHNPRAYLSIRPTGEFGEEDPRARTWFSLDPIAKAVSIFKDPSLANINQQLGEQNKVRSFDVNITDPLNPNAVTMDTHAVAGIQGRPLGASATAVNQNFGSTPMKNKQPADWQAAKNDADSGIQGTYGMNAEAMRQAAHERGVLPREMQSVTWEAIRSLFPSKFKTAANLKKVDDIWREYGAGKISHDAAWDRIIDLAGGFKGLHWHGATPEITERRGRSSYEGQFSRPSVGNKFLAA